MSSKNFVDHQLKLLVNRILYAHQFNSASSKALDVIVDLLSRYLELLASTCASFAQHSGRKYPNAFDAVMALEELGMDVSDIIEWCSRDGVELVKYPLTLRSDYFQAFSAALADGTRQDNMDALFVEYQQLPSPPSELKYNDENQRGMVSSPPFTSMNGIMSHPVLPLSPVSNPPTPIPASPRGKKRRRSVLEWTDAPPQHIPGFLPPFPGNEAPSSPETDSEDMVISPVDMPLELPPENSLSNDPPPPPPQPQPVVPSLPLSVASYFETIPFERSTLATTTAERIPSPPSRNEPMQGASAHPYLLVAMQTAHEHADLGTPNPSRLAISTALSLTAAPRYTASDTLFSSSHPSPPRNLAPPPSYAAPTNPSTLLSPLPPGSSRSINSSSISLNPQPSYLFPRIRALSERMVKREIHDRTTKIVPPPAFTTDRGPLLHGRPVPAPWNAPPGTAVPNDKPAALVDASLYTTWDYPVKSFEDTLKKKGVEGKHVDVASGLPNETSETVP